MHALVFDAAHTGHHLTYVGYMLPALKQLTPRVTFVTSSQAVASGEYEEKVKPISDGIEIDSDLNYKHDTPLKTAVTNLRALRQAVLRHRPDHVFVPSADGVSQLIGLQRLLGMRPFPKGTQAEAALHGTRFASVQPTLHRRLSGRLSVAANAAASWDRLFYVDVLGYDYVQHRGGGLAARCELLPDPILPRPPLTPVEARQKLGLPADGRYIGCCGTLNRAKGIDRLVHAFKRANLGATDRLLLAGRVSDDFKPWLENELAPLVQSGNAVLIDRFLTDEEMHATLSAMDVVSVAYPRHYAIASILLRAAAAQRPVISSTFGWVGMVTHRFGLGQVCNVLDEDAFVKAVKTQLGRSQDYKPSSSAQRFVAFNSVANFNATWTSRLRQRMALPPSEDLLTWQWVLETV